MYDTGCERMIVQVRDRITLKIESVAFGGSGVGRVDGFVIFVPFTASADVVEVEIVEKKKKFARARLLNIIEPSPLRTVPQCRCYGRCGGCCYQHITYDGQLKIKHRQVVEAFLKIGGIAEPPVKEIIPSPQPYAYRGKAELHAEKTKSGVKLGFMDVSGGRVVDIERCEIMDEAINGQIRQARSKGFSPDDADNLIFWSEPVDPASGIVTRRVKDLEFLVPRTGFFQANLYLTGRMVDEVLRLAEHKKIETIVDACCGSGLFSVFLAPCARRLIGIEISEKSVKCARANAERHHVQNAEFVCGDIEEVLRNMARGGDTVDVILLDPPRTGLSPEALAAVCDLQSSDIIYVSCNPATQARDVRMLLAHGFCLKSLQPLDMFSQTEHVEIVAWLTADRRV